MNAERWPTAHNAWMALRMFWKAKSEIGFDHAVTPDPTAPATERVIEAFPGAQVVTAPAKAKVTRIEPTQPAWERPDDGDPVDIDTIKAQIVAAIAGDVTVEADLKRWVAEGKRAGRSWRITDHPVTRCRQIYRVAVRLSRWASDDDDVRTAIGVVLCDEVQPSVSVGKALGSLTIDEATRLIDVATALDGGAAITFDDDGKAMVA